MAQINNAAAIGPHSTRLTAAAKAVIGNYDRALGSAGIHHVLEFPPSMFVWPLIVLTTANANAKSSLKVKAPRPLTIWAIDVGCESAAGSAGTVDVLVDDVSVLDAAEDVKTTAGTAVRVAPETTKDSVTYNQTIKITQTGTGSGDMVGGQAHLYCQWA